MCQFSEDEHAVPTVEGTRLAILLWHGGIGGAETFTSNLAARLRTRGVDARVVFVTRGGPLEERLDSLSVPHSTLGFRRGRDVIPKARVLARSVERISDKGALLAGSGLLPLGLRLGGFRGQIVVTEHGNWLQTPKQGPSRRALERLQWSTGARAADVQCAVSDFMLEVVREHTHAHRTVRIYNGIDLTRYRPRPSDGHNDSESVIGFAGRLIPGKGVETLLNAFARDQLAERARLTIAGDGPLRSALETHAVDLGVRARVDFLGTVSEMDRYWANVDIAAIPSSEWVESFCLAAVEAMACGKPVVATSAGALPEIIASGRTGVLVEPGNDTELARALVAYLNHPEVQLRHGRAASERCRAEFDIETTADRYHRLLASIGALD